MSALDLIVRQGKALYVGISNYQAEDAEKAIQMLRQLGTPCLIHQPKYSMFERWVEGGLLEVLEKEGVGCIPFSPLAQGLLTDKYLNGVPADSRVAKPHGFLKENHLTEETLGKIKRLNALAEERNQTLAQMALGWLLKDKRVTSVLIGVSKAEQLIDSLQALENTNFSEDELSRIESILKG
jgi:L-glyceraldehyde 3-phosphate reductase